MIESPPRARTARRRFHQRSTATRSRKSSASGPSRSGLAAMTAGVVDGRVPSGNTDSIQEGVTMEPTLMKTDDSGAGAEDELLVYEGRTEQLARPRPPRDPA